MGEEDILKKQENKWRKGNSFATLEIVDEAKDLVFARFLVQEIWNNEKFQGFNRESWPIFLSERYGGLFIEAISSYHRKKELEKCLEEWLVATVEEIPDKSEE